MEWLPALDSGTASSRRLVTVATALGLDTVEPTVIRSSRYDGPTVEEQRCDQLVQDLISDWPMIRQYYQYLLSRGRAPAVRSETIAELVALQQHQPTAIERYRRFRAEYLAETLARL